MERARATRGLSPSPMCTGAGRRRCTRFLSDRLSPALAVGVACTAVGGPWPCCGLDLDLVSLSRVWTLQCTLITLVTTQCSVDHTTALGMHMRRVPIKYHYQRGAREGSRVFGTIAIDLVYLTPEVHPAGGPA